MAVCEKDALRKVIDLGEARQLLEKIRLDRGCPSGYRQWDRFTGGLVKDGVTLIAGRPGMGKTSLALNVVGRLSQQQDGTILVFSPHLWSADLAVRLMSVVMDMTPESFFDNSLPGAEVAKRFSDYYQTKTGSVKIESQGFLSVDEIWERCFETPDLRLVVVTPIEELYQPIDFSQDLTEWNPKKEAADVIFQTLQRLAYALDVPVLCTASLHRSLEKRKNKRPRMTDLKKVGIPEALVDQVVFLYRDRYYDAQGDGSAEWIIGKSPRGETGSLWMDWDGATGNFREFEV